MRVVAAIAISSDRISIGMIVESIAISLYRVSMDVDGGFDGGFDGQFHLAVLGYWPQQSIWQLRWAAVMAISQEGLMGLLWNELVVCTLVLQASLNELVVFQALSKALWTPLLNASLKAL